MQSMDTEAIGRRLRELRGDRPQKEVADAVGVTPMSISYYESGQKVPGDDVKIALAEFFGKTVEQIFFTKEVNR